MNCKICNGKLVVWYKKIFDDRHGYPGYFDIYKCLKCEFAQTYPQLTRKKISEVYSKYYPWQKIKLANTRRSDFIKPNMLKIWMKGLGINGQYLVKPNSEVLDVGCGLGYSILELQNMGCKAYGIDPDKNALRLAKKFNLNIRVGFIEKDPFPKNKFDYVIANQVLEHTNNPVDFVKRCSKKLNTNGKLILSFPNTNSLTRHILGKDWLHWHIPYHLNFFTKKAIELLARKNGLKILSIKTVTPNMWTNLQMRRLFQKPKMGIRDQFWDGKGSNTGLMKFNFYRTINNFLENYNLINRLIDLSGYGESFVVELRKS